MAFTCPFCGITSHNLNDERERYCAECCLFVDDPLIPAFEDCVYRDACECTRRGYHRTAVRLGHTKCLVPAIKQVAKELGIDLPEDIRPPYHDDIAFWVDVPPSGPDRSD